MKICILRSDSRKTVKSCERCCWILYQAISSPLPLYFLWSQINFISRQSIWSLTMIHVIIMVLICRLGCQKFKQFSIRSLRKSICCNLCVCSNVHCCCAISLYHLNSVCTTISSFIMTASCFCFYWKFCWKHCIIHRFNFQMWENGGYMIVCKRNIYNQYSVCCCNRFLEYFWMEKKQHVDRSVKLSIFSQNQPKTFVVHVLKFIIFDRKQAIRNCCCENTFHFIYKNVQLFLLDVLCIYANTLRHVSI